MPNRDYLYAVSIMVGTAIGAGVFGLPYVASKSGFIPALLLVLILGSVTLILNLMYGEVTLRTANKGRLVGYCEKYIGDNGKKVAAFITFFSLYANILAYIILGGVFLNALFSGYFGGNEFVYSLIIFLLVSGGIYVSLKLVSFMELLMVAFLFVAIIGIIFKGFAFVSVDNLLSYDFSQSFFPFGVVLFSFGALSAIPELEHIIKEKQRKIKGAIIAGTIIPAVVFILFMGVVVGVTGSNTSQEALSGLNSVMGDGVVTLGLIFGVLAITTSYLMIGINLKEVFWYDYHLSEKKSWALTCFVPFIVFVLGLRDFITVANIAGSIAGGLVGILVITVFYKAKGRGDMKPAYEIRVPMLVSAFMVFVYILGIVYQFVYRG
jgi:tyrosine-specific transport protein